MASPARGAIGERFRETVRERLDCDRSIVVVSGGVDGRELVGPVYRDGEGADVVVEA